VGVAVVDLSVILLSGADIVEEAFEVFAVTEDEDEEEVIGTLMVSVRAAQVFKTLRINQ
jgi:hypothetical protein